MSFKIHQVSNIEKHFNKLVFSYLNHHSQINDLYSHYPNLQGFQNAINEIAKFSYNRNILSNILLQQASSVSNTSIKSIENINLLTQENTFTITTGHQLCLFTGPAYFIYKIASTIQLSNQLKQHFPKYNFVPVFWLNTEDHDINEINHFYFNDKKYLWNVNTNGIPVFSINTNGLEDLFEEMKSSNSFSEEALNLFKTTYLHHTSYTQATRYIINELFGKEGIVIIEPNEKIFKEQFKQYFYQDIFESFLYQSIQPTIKKLNEGHYPVQVNPREINTFLFYNNKRILIQKQEDNFHLKNTDVKFDKSELQKHLDAHPENFSPNVLLRPVYQQKILPNIAYIGGSAEVSYWLELKDTFQSFNTFYPIIIQRPVLFLLPQNIYKKITKLNLSIDDLFEKDKHELIKQIMDNQNLSIHLEEYHQKFLKIFDELTAYVEPVDKTLIAYLNAEKTKSINFLEKLEHKLNRHIKQKNETLLQQTDSIYSTLFPNDIMQERIWNIFYIAKILDISVFELLKNISPQCNIDLHNTFKIKVLINE